jgi:hypothetical protein
MSEIKKITFWWNTNKGREREKKMNYYSTYAVNPVLIRKLTSDQVKPLEPTNIASLWGIGSQPACRDTQVCREICPSGQPNLKKLY